MPTILSPIQDDLTQVEACLLAETALPYPHLGDVLNHLFQAGGKRVRPALALLAARAIAGETLVPAPVIQFAAGAELLHTATLVHDDMVDHSALRRGQSTLNTQLPAGLVILIGDYLFARSAVLGSSLENVPLMTLFAHTLETICSGELRQAFSSRDWRQSEEAYYQKIYSKTAALFVLATEGGAMLAQASPDAQQALREYGHQLGLAFQIVDDILDFVGTARELGKPVGSDLRQGTITLPALHYLAAAPADNPVRAYLDRAIDAPEDARQRQLSAALAAIIGSPAIESSYHRARTLAHEAQAALHALPASPYRNALHNLAEYVVRRRT